jgi:hypothetical protein
MDCDLEEEEEELRADAADLGEEKIEEGREIDEEPVKTDL